MTSSSLSWIRVDETAKAALLRILTERPTVVLPPPLHRLPLRAGNVVEIVGPSPSAKTLFLIQAAINCVLPKEWNGVQFGGVDRPVLFVDLDCRFDVLCLSRALRSRISGAYGAKSHLPGNENECDEELFAACMRRFLYIRCYNSYELLASLKTMRHRLQQVKEKQGSAAYMLLVDSIGAFYWMDRALPSSSSGSNSRKSFSVQSVAETIVQEIQRLLLHHPMLVLASKSASFSDKQSKTEMARYSGKRSDEMVLDSGGPRNLPHREYMPSVWQSFVSHRILLRASDGEIKYRNRPTFSTEWLLPSVKFSDNFIVNDDGLIVIL